MDSREGPPDALSGPADPARVDPYGLRGQTVGHYTVDDVLGGGGMGVVYRAEDVRLRRTVALKFLPPFLRADAEARDRFLAEAQAASRLDHPNICTVHEVGETDDGHPYIAMAYYAGETLRARMARGPLPADAAADLVAQLARGLARAHEAGLVHRDVKPANVIVTPDGQAKLLDFGVAKVADSLLTRTGATLGTTPYMSPEQTRGDAIDGRADVWALGVVLYEALTGVRPFRGAYDQAVIYAILHEDPEPPSAVRPELPPAFDAIVGRCLDKDLAHRYPDAHALAADLDALRQGQMPPSGEPLAAAAPAPRRRLGWRVAAGGAGVLAVAAAALWVRPGGQPNLPSVPTSPSTRQVAVLPFTNVGGDSTNQAFIDGLVYTIGATLSGLEQVSDRLSVLPTDDGLGVPAGTPREAAQALGADLVVSGSVQRAADRVRLTLEVYDAATDQRLGSRLLDTSGGDLLALQDSVALVLADLLSLELTEADQRALAAGGTTSTDAFDAYMQARGALGDYETEANVDRAVALFRQALAADERYALAWAGLGEAYWRKYEVSNEPRWVDLAAQAGQRAVALDDDLAPVRVALGMIYKGTGRYADAERELRQALTLDPDDATAHQQIAATLYHLDRTDEAIAEYRRAIALKPRYWGFYNNLGNVLTYLGRDAEALPLFRQVVALRPDNPWGYSNLAGAFRNLGETDSAVVWLQRATEANPAATGPTAEALVGLGILYESRADYTEAARTYRRAVALDSLESDHWFFLGNALYLAGERASADRAWRRMIALDERVVAVNPRDEDGLIGLAYGYAWTDRPERAREPLARLSNLPQKRALTYLLVARIHERLGNRPAALAALSDGLDDGLDLAEVERSPWLTALRADPGYRRLPRPAPTP